MPETAPVSRRAGEAEGEQGAQAIDKARKGHTQARERSKRVRRKSSHPMETRRSRTTKPAIGGNKEARKRERRT